MAVNELKKFKFFDLHENVDKGALSAALKGTHITVATSGHGFYVFGDGEGNIVSLNKRFEASIFKAYNFQITLAEFIRHSPFLVTVGDDETGVNPSLKVWNTDITDKGGNPKCINIIRLLQKQQATQATALGVHESATFLAVGFQNGSISLYHGDITRGRNKTPKILVDGGSSAVTGLAFRTSAMASYLFVTNAHSVFSYDITTKDREVKCMLDTKEGCAVGCSAMADLPHEAHFVVAGQKAIFCYTTDGKGPCYAMEGEKTLIQWSKSFLAIASKDAIDTDISSLIPSSASASQAAAEKYTVSVLDTFNNLIVFTSSLVHVKAILIECGSFYIVTNDHNIHQLCEKDVQSKLALLFKKNLYDAAIRMAKSQHYDEDGLVDIFRQYGDHLHSKGDRAGAIEQYIKTIGRFEPSYIIRKFMDSAHMEQLMEYLQALHRKGVATGDHTTLLLNCYIKLGKATDLKDFIMTKGRKVDFDIETALKVVRGVSIEDALSLAKAHGRHYWYVRILLEDQKRYQDAINYIATLDFCHVVKCILDFGGLLMEHAPAETTQFLKDLCIDHFAEPKPIESQLFELEGSGNSSVRPQDFLHLFLLKSEYLVEFLEHLVNTRTGWDRQIYNALVEHYLVLWSKNRNSSIEQRLLKLLQNPDASYDREHAFILCQMYNFAPGRVLLYEENKMYYQVVQTHMEEKNYKAVLASCRRFGHQDPNIWIQALWSVAHQPDTPQHVLSEILSHIEKERLQPPVLTIEALGEGTTLGQARRYLEAVLQTEDELVAKENAVIAKFSQESSRLRNHISNIENNTNVFQGSRCGVCERQLDLPSVHFLCQHSFHQHCLQRYSENDNECFVCRKNNKVLKDMINLQDQRHELHQTFHDELEKVDDRFSVVADYFGRGVFNKVPLANPDPVVPGIPSVALVSRTNPIKTLSNESPSKALQVPAATNQRKSPLHNSVESDLIAFSLTKPTAMKSTSHDRRVEPEPDLSSSMNPFDDDDDEDLGNATNPFADEANESKNPFSSGEEGEYDDSLNPFND